MEDESSTHADTKPLLDTRPQWRTSTPYKKLETSHIRLLCVRISSTDQSEPLICTLSTHALPTAPAFRALSYTWGLPLRNIATLRKSPARPNRNIICDGHEAQVGQNLYDFLLHCATGDLEELQDYLWIDALSINQGDIEERSEQVQLMSEIYQRAASVFVWLGPEDYATGAAIGLMKGIVRLELFERRALQSTDVGSDHTNPLLDLNNWEALARFFQREWYRRAWIIQEVVLARDVTVLCGPHSISWDDLRTFSQFCVNSSWVSLLEKLAGQNRMRGKGTRTLGHNTAARLASAKRTWQSTHDDKFLHALIRARMSDSENPRDKVYSQLGLGSAAIFPDYNASVADVYIRTAKYILEHSSTLLLLTCVEGPDFQHIPDLPSWVPDWSVNHYLGLRTTGYPSFHAAGNLRRQYSLSEDDNGTHVLRIKATQLDEITNPCEPKAHVRNNIHTSHLWHMLSSLDPVYAGGSARGQTREEALWRTLFTNREDAATSSNPVNLRYPASISLGTSFRDWVLWRYVCARDDPTVFPPLSSPGAAAFLPSETEIVDAMKQSKVDEMYAADLARRAAKYAVHYSHAMLVRPFATRNGYVGLGTLCLEKGDTVWIVPGCPVPLILRKVDAEKRGAQGNGMERRRERYRLVGGAYVHGFMNGEGVRDEGIEFEVVDLE